MLRFGVIMGLILLLMVIPASAYIDPGTGGYIISGIGPLIWAMLLAAGGFIVALFRRVIIDKAKQNKVATIIILILLVIIVYLLLDASKEPESVTSGGLLTTDAPDDKPAPELVKPAPAKATIKGGIQPDSELLFDDSVSGAHTYYESGVFDGYNLYEGKLIDMDGNLVNNWSSIYLGVIDDDGNYYAQKYYEADTFGKYTWDDKIIWEKKVPIHHVIFLEGDILYTFTKDVHIYNGRDVEFDIILEVNATTGEEISHYSLWGHLSEFQQFHRALELDKPESYDIPDEHRMNKSIWGGSYDYYHINYMQLLPENSLSSQYKAFQEGNWLISFRHGSMVFILDKDTKEIVWRAIYDQVPGTIEGQHAVQMLPSGKILIMDNGRYREWSRVIELDPLTLEVTWELKAPWFYTLSQGHAQRLSNGNTLVTEAEKGYVFEVTGDGQIVWDFYNPEKYQKDTYSYEETKLAGQREEIYKMERYPKDFIDALL